MTTEGHPITPPPLELVNQWDFECGLEENAAVHIATQAARWGADQELDACCEWFVRDWTAIETADKLRAARRPKPPSLKAQALQALKHAEEGWRPVPEDCALIRRALETLPD